MRSQGEFAESRVDHRMSNKILDDFFRAADLKPGAHVLDVSCGFGQFAHKLAHYLAPPARFYGLDIMGRLIKTCSTLQVLATLNPLQTDQLHIFTLLRDSLTRRDPQ